MFDGAVNSVKKKFKKKLISVLLTILPVVLGIFIFVSALLSVATFVGGLFSGNSGMTKEEVMNLSLPEVIEAVKDKKKITNDMLEDMMITRKSLLYLLEEVQKVNTEYVTAKKKIQYKHEYITKETVLDEFETETEITISHTDYKYSSLDFSTEDYEGGYELDWQPVYLMAVFDTLNRFESEKVEETTIKETNEEGVLSETDSSIIGSVVYMDTPYDNYFDAAAAESGLPVNLIKSLAKQESSFRNLAENRVGAIGVMQVTEGAMKEVNKSGYTFTKADLTDPEKNIMVGALYLALRLKYHDGDVVLAVAAYNCGSGNVDKAGGTVPNFTETVTHVCKVIGYYTGKEITDLADILGKYNIDTSGIQIGIGKMKKGKLVITEEDAKEIINTMRAHFFYYFDVVRDSKKKYTLEECMELPNHEVQISGDPDTEAGQITICVPKSLLNSVELAFADILFQHDNKNILATNYLIQMGRWNAIADRYSEIYDVEWFADLLKELPRGWEPLDTFSYYAALADFSVDDYKREQKGSGDFGSASGVYEPLDYVKPSIDIPSTAGGMSIPLYLQYDSRWGALSWGASDSISSAGCGPTSLAMVLSFLTGKCIYPSDVRAWSGAYNSRYCESGGASKQALFTEGAKKWGVTCVYIPAVSTNAILNALSKGYPVIVSTGAYHTTEFTNKGHFIVLRGLTEDGKILVNDPNDRIGTKNHYIKAYEPSFIESACYWTKGGGKKYGFYFYN